MNEFLNDGLTAYAKTRNFVHPRGKHSNISRLSPYLRHRLVTEQELVRAVVEILGEIKSRAFIDEVFWRCYWKAYLQQRPSLIRGYERDLERLNANPEAGYHDAISGRAQIACFDDWTHELLDTGYLHNHARMWWASMWCFTLNLPWQLGADFFMQHLIDADPASNTLSWRWVAGLHSPGKIYRASAQNITTFTQERYVAVQGLAQDPVVPEHAHPEQEQDPLAPWIVAEPESLDSCSDPTGLLVLGHDLHPESQWQEPIGPIAIWSPQESSDHPAARFRRGAWTDAAQRLESWSQASVSFVPTLGALARWAQNHQLARVVMSTPPLAQGLHLVPAISKTLAPIELQLHTRPWDRVAWRHAERGYFRFRKKNAAALLALATGTNA